ncbi:sulfite exporter TauE/SafE family protein [Candidatus Margulisiibacteriota bacterium]
MLAKAFYLFSQGVILGWGPCLLFCGIYILPAATFAVSKKRDAFRNFIAFMTGRFLIYVFLGILSGLIGMWVLDQSVAEIFHWVFLILILGMGVFILFRKQEQNCFADKAVQKNFFILGLLVGLAPCAPLLGILMQILLLSKTITESIIYSMAFGLGTLINPLWLILWGFSELREKLRNSPIIFILQKLIGLFLIIFVLLNIYKLF